ncbi:MAG: ATP-cone domain-containing protein [Parcubacteria group bacterium GW2011_GWC1_38_6]|nr:MAG: ATP-cone domain-containing protein [Parcubacteria group bacterium GW2011_GWC1_38_6]
MSDITIKNVLVQKASGRLESFSEQKLRRSLRRVKAPHGSIDKVIERIKWELKPGIKTSEIYRHALSLLKKEEKSVAIRYSLKKAIMELGPSGHPFEALVGEILRTQGFAVKVGQMIQGFCVKHEIDVIATKGGSNIVVECKFHNEFGTKSDVKTALYVKARFDDIKMAERANHNGAEKITETWLITNTKLTSNAIRYSSCVGLKAIGWNYPRRGGLEALIDQANLYPITCLTSLNSSQKKHLLDGGLVLCKDIGKRQSLLAEIGLTGKKLDALKLEIDNLTNLD